jgi:benzoyl-CoA reductase/2-hydroxyglutaryl-CoA dehydratase subunit BcrC/BadD/HgdB
MPEPPKRITLDDWDRRYQTLKSAGLCEPAYGGPLRRHVEDGDLRLTKLRMDNSPAALRLWNFLLSEEDRLRQARAEGKRIVGAMKDLGTVPVMAYSLDDTVAFYPDGAWWLPCIMENQTGMLELADRHGIDDSFCPVRAMLGALISQAHFPLPDLLTCSVGATCDDLSAIAQRLAGLGFDIFWWEMPHRRRPEPGEPAVILPGGFSAPQSQVDFVRGELDRVRRILESLTGQVLDDCRLAAGIVRANRVRALLAELRRLAYTAAPCPMPALEMLIAEMLALHFCSDQAESEAVLADLLAEVKKRIHDRQGVLADSAVRVYWVNPVADLRAMNILEDAGGRIGGTDLMFCHALEPIPEDLPPMEALARSALADPMVGSPIDRAERITADLARFGAEAVVISRIPGASHCALEGRIIAEILRRERGVPVIEIEISPLSDALEPTLRTRLEALVETVKGRQSPPLPLGEGRGEGNSNNSSSTPEIGYYKGMDCSH